MASASSAISPGAGFGLKLTLLACETAEEYVFAELCEALTLSLAAENEARIRSVTAANSNVSKCSTARWRAPAN